MRLINTETMEMVSFFESLELISRKYPYAILSHTWEDGEVSFQDYQEPERESKKGFKKIKACCMQAMKDSIGWVWIDTCCIDKKDSAELSEAINSMYAWYRESAVCYAFLKDVPPRSPHFPEDEFRRARWFTRGWCLQELIAPLKVEFYATNWSELGTKWSLSPTISEITGISHDALHHNRPLSDFPAAQRMSWASKRNTTRIEDTAYCLLGIFDINMPLIYGEGEKSFTRLQMEILKWEGDYSLLINKSYIVHAFDDSILGGGSVASGPDQFKPLAFTTLSGESCNYGGLRSIHHVDNEIAKELMKRSPPHITSKGLRIPLLISRARWDPGFDRNSLLAWTEYTYDNKLVCLRFKLARRNPLSTYKRDAPYGVQLVDTAKLNSFYMKSLQLEAGQSGIHREFPANAIIPQCLTAVKLALSLTCTSKLDLIQTSPPMERSNESHVGHTERICFRDFEPGRTTVSRALDTFVFNLHLRLYHDIVGMGPFDDLIVTVFTHPKNPRCMIKPFSQSHEFIGCDGNQPASQDFESQASDFSALELSSGYCVTSLVKIKRKLAINIESFLEPDLVNVNINVYSNKG